MEGNTICVVDDDMAVLRSVKELLASNDIEVEMFNNPRTFLDYVRAHRVSVAVLDAGTDWNSIARALARFISANQSYSHYWSSGSSDSDGSPTARSCCISG